MSGYCGYSMSNNAVDAYSNGEKPWSKWTKADILAETKDRITCNPNLFKKLNVNELRDYCLCYEGWHHTSNWYNETEFYSVDDRCSLLSDDDIMNIISKRETKQKQVERKATCEFLEWSGTRNHPKAIKITEDGIIKGNWFYRKDGTKKNINAKGFNILEEKEN